MTLDEAIEELRNSEKREHGYISFPTSRVRAVLAAYDAERAVKHEELAWQCGARFWCSDACEAKWREQNPSVHDAERAAKPKQCEPWCGRKCPPSGSCYGDITMCLCSKECQDAGRPVSPKVTP